MFTNSNFTPLTLRYVGLGRNIRTISESHLKITTVQLCTVDMEIRELERETINLVPELVFMESDTILVQYIISSWSLQYRNNSE